MRYVDSFVQELNRLGTPVGRLLNQVNLSEEMLVRRDDFIAVPQLWRLTALAAEHTGKFDIGFDAGLTPLQEHSQFGQHLVYAPTLHQAFDIFCRMAPGELTNAEFGLRRDADTVWFCGGPVYGSAAEQLQVGLYRIAMLIQLVRWAAGEDWQPDKIQLQTDSLETIESDLLRGATLEFNCAGPAVALPSALLGRKLLIEPSSSAFTPGTEANLSMGFRNSLKEFLRTHIRGHRFHIEQAARALDLPVRSLQRKLAEHGLVYSELLEQTRVELASELLQATNMKIGDIARIVGYSESTHFSRAFRRVTGNTPRHYRQQLRV